MPANEITRANEALAVLLECVEATLLEEPMHAMPRVWDAVASVRRALAEGYALRPDPHTAPPLDASITRLVGR
jgi:hypothetical protein